MSNSAQKRQVWLQGYAAACATLNARRDIDYGKRIEMVQHLMLSGGVTLDVCKKAKVEPHIIEALFGKQEKTLNGN